MADKVHSDHPEHVAIPATPAVPAVPAQKPKHSDTNAPGTEAPPGSSTTSVPQQIPKTVKPATPTSPDKTETSK